MLGTEHPVELLAGHFAPAPLHAAGLHDDRSGQRTGLPVGQIPQRIADAEQDFRSPVRMQVAQQRIVVVQIESSSALPDQPVGHIDQRRTFALQITRQQSEYRHTVDRSVKALESEREGLLVYAQIGHIVLGGRLPGRTAARKHLLGLVVGTVNPPGFEQLDREERNLTRRLDPLGTNPDQPEILPVRFAALGLKTEHVERRTFERGVVSYAKKGLQIDHNSSDYSPSR